MKMEMHLLHNYKVFWLFLLCIHNVAPEIDHENKDKVTEGNEEESGIGETFGETYWQADQDKQSDFKENIPIRVSRDSTKHGSARVRREVRSLVEALKANAEKLENLTSGLAFLVNSAKAEQIGYFDMMKSLENLTSDLAFVVNSAKAEQVAYSDTMKSLENMNPFFVSMIVMLADVAFSTSPRLAKHQEDMGSLMTYFRKNITTQADKEMFDNLTYSVFEWHIKPYCKGLHSAGFRESGSYIIRIPDTEKLLRVWCDQETDGGGWLVFQRRQDGSVDFLRSWSEYQQGFGDVNGEFWLGNDNLHYLTNKSQELRVDLMDFDGNTAYAKYSSFAVGSSHDNYTLTVSGYSGTAGDSLKYHNGMGFSATDRDNKNGCVKQYKGPWWYKKCHHANLNGLYIKNAKVDAKSACWLHWKNKYEALKRTEMKIRPSV